MEAAARMTGSPRVVLGMPAYDRPDTLARTIESLLSQSFDDFALVVVDDAGTRRSAEIVESYAKEFPRVSYEANPERLGMIGNWRKVFERGRQLYPRSEYFAWVSDHDLWHARWLQEMVAVLDQHPDVVLAYPRHLQVTADGVRQTGKVKVFETFGVTDRAERIRMSARYMLSGDMIYGLMRSDALQRAGIFRRVITPDRQVLLALSLLGQFRQVPEVLWYREFIRRFDVQRQRKAFFPRGIPLHSYLPSHLQHFAVLAWDFAVRGAGRPAFGRLAGLRYAVSQLWWSTVRDAVRPKSDWRVKVSRWFPGSVGRSVSGATRP
jgi:glycosyltransferase involved in cell wall biosynthesis